MLYTDAPFITGADLVMIDPSAGSVCQTESIDMDSIIRESIEEVADRIQAGMQSWGTLYRNSGVSFAHSMAVRGYSSEVAVPRAQINQVVVTASQTQFSNPLKRTVCYTALYNLYRAASNRKIDDKYQAKAKTFAESDRKY